MKQIESEIMIIDTTVEKSKDFQYYSWQQSTRKFDPEEVKDEDGNWTRWVPERMTEEMIKAYEELKELMIKESDKIDFSHLSENELLRFVNAYQLNIGNVLECLIKNEQWISECNGRNLELSMFEAINEMNYYSLAGFDKVGRPIIAIRLGNFLPDKVSVDEVGRFIYCLMYKAGQYLDNQKTDQFIMVYDCHGLGYKNFDKAKALKLIETSQ